MVRRAEYALGKAIRAGQDAGTIRSPHASGGPKGDYMRGSTLVHVDQGRKATLNSPTDFATPAEMSGTSGREGIYAMTDDVTATEFEAALSDAKTEGNLSRANVVRKIKGVKTDDLTPVERLVKIRELAPSPPH